jgi:xylan 1,4-beta-xylosidase
LRIKGLEGTRVLVHHYRIDQEHSNSFEKWKAMGSPQHVGAEQYRELEKAGELEMLSSPEWKETVNETIELKFDLPRQGVSLIRLTW